MGIVIALIVIGVVISIHEFGHFIFAKLAKCAVLQFAIGFGPKIFSFRKRETEYRLNILPFGGYVKFWGEEGEGGEEEEKAAETAGRYGLKNFAEISGMRKFSIFAGGVLTQFVAAILILTMIVAFLGMPQPKPVLVNVLPDSPAERAGFEKNDLIVSVNGEQVIFSQEAIEIVKKSEGKEILFEIKRGDDCLNLSVVPEYSEKERKPMIGVGFSALPDYMNTGAYTKAGMRPLDFLTGGVKIAVNMFMLVIFFLYLLIAKIMPLTAAGGPIGIIAMTGEVAKTGLMSLFIWGAFININLIVINSLPLPALDGGHILLLFIEKLFRTEIKPRVREIINNVGFIMIILLALYITHSDVKKLIRGKGDYLKGAASEFQEINDNQTPQDETGQDR